MAFIVFFSIVYLVLLKIMMDSEWTFDRSRKIVGKEKGETGLKEVKSKDEDWEEWNTKDGEDDASVRNLSGIIKAESDGESAKSWVVGGVTMTGGDKGKITAIKALSQGGDMLEAGKRLSTPEKTTQVNATKDDSDPKRHQVTLSDAGHQEDGQDMVSIRKLLMVNSKTKTRELFLEKQKAASPSRVKNQSEALPTISGEDLRPWEPKNVAGVAKLFLSAALRPDEPLSLRPRSLNTPHEEPLRRTSEGGHTIGRWLTVASAANLSPHESPNAGPPRLLTYAAPDGEESIVLDIAVSGLGVTVTVNGRQVRKV